MRQDVDTAAAKEEFLHAASFVKTDALKKKEKLKATVNPHRTLPSNPMDVDGADAQEEGEDDDDDVMELESLKSGRQNDRSTKTVVHKNVHLLHLYKCELHDDERLRDLGWTGKSVDDTWNVCCRKLFTCFLHLPDLEDEDGDALGLTSGSVSEGGRGLTVMLEIAAGMGKKVMQKLNCRSRYPEGVQEEALEVYYDTFAFGAMAQVVILSTTFRGVRTTIKEALAQVKKELRAKQHAEQRPDVWADGHEAPAVPPEGQQRKNKAPGKPTSNRRAKRTTGVRRSARQQAPKTTQMTDWTGAEHEVRVDQKDRVQELTQLHTFDEQFESVRKPCCMLGETHVSPRRLMIRWLLVGSCTRCWRGTTSGSSPKWARRW